MPTPGMPAPGMPATGVAGAAELGYPAAPVTNRTIWAGPRHAAPHDWTSLSALLTIEKPVAAADAGLLVLRLAVGLTMAAHGAQKAFGMFGGLGLSATADGFSALGYQPGILFALAAVVGELFGGLLLAAGLLTPLAAGGIIGVTVNAMVAVNLGNGFFASNDGIELPLVLAGGALTLLLAGPGRYAADARIPFFNGAAVQCAAAGIAMFAMLTSLGAHLF
jgi:putative oxidoreductase